MIAAPKAVSTVWMNSVLHSNHDHHVPVVPTLQTSNDESSSLGARHGRGLRSKATPTRCTPKNVVVHDLVCLSRDEDAASTSNIPYETSTIISVIGKFCLTET